jgi:hypothetical protein
MGQESKPGFIDAVSFRFLAVKDGACMSLNSQGHPRAELRKNSEHISPEEIGVSR